MESDESGSLEDFSLEEQDEAVLLLFNLYLLAPYAGIVVCRLRKHFAKLAPPLQLNKGDTHAVLSLF